MSVTVYWEPIRPGRALKGQSTVKDALERMFGKMPLLLDAASVENLRGMASVWTGEDNPYESLIEAIDKHDRVRVFAEY